jgi:hypothetical protein
MYMPILDLPFFNNLQPKITISMVYVRSDFDNPEVAAASASHSATFSYVYGEYMVYLCISIC